MKKACVICGIEFDARRNAKTCSPACRETNKRTQQRRWVADNIERVRNNDRNRVRVRKNIASIRASQKRWLLRNYERVIAANRERMARKYASLTRDERLAIIARNRQWRAANRDKYNNYCHARHAANPGRRRSQQRKSYRRDREIELALEIQSLLTLGAKDECHDSD